MKRRHGAAVRVVVSHSRAVLGPSGLQTRTRHFPPLRTLPQLLASHILRTKGSPLTCLHMAPSKVLLEDDVGKTATQRALHSRSMAPGHLPGDGTLAVVPLARELLHFADSFCLDLIQGLATGQPHVVHALGIAHSQASSLSSSQEQHCHLVLRDLMQA